MNVLEDVVAISPFRMFLILDAKLDPALPNVLESCLDSLRETLRLASSIMVEPHGVDRAAVTIAPPAFIR
jgi:hypothetical protein